MTLSVFATFSLCVYVRFCVRMNASYVMVGVGVVVYVPMIYIRNIYMYNKGGDREGSGRARLYNCGA